MATYKAKVWDGSAWQTVGSNLLNSADYATKTYLSSSINALPGRNLLHNGAFQVAQRGSSAAGITADQTYNTADRWKLQNVTLGAWTQSVENDAPTGSGFRKSLKMLCTTADASPAAGDAVSVIQLMEGQNLQTIKKGTSSAQPLTLSFWVKSNKTGTYTVFLYDTDNTRSVSASYTISSSATWEQKVITFPADLTGALDNDANDSMSVWFSLGAGSNYTSGTLGTTWSTYTAANSRVGQTNLAAATNNYWQVAGVQLEVGSAATGFEWKDYGTELRECQRYYWRTNSTSYLCMCQAYSTTNAIGFFQHPVAMRANMVSGGFTAQGGANDYYVYKADANILNVTGAPTFLTGSHLTTGVTFSVASGLVAGNATIAGSVTTNGSFGFSADL